MAHNWDSDDENLFYLDLERARRRVSRSRRQRRTEEPDAPRPHRRHLRSAARQADEQEESWQLNDLLDVDEILDDEDCDWP